MTTLGLNTEYKHVRLRLHKKLVPKFVRALPKGFDVTIYPVAKTQRKQYYDENIRNVTFNVTRRQPNPTQRKDKNDIDEFLANLNRIDPRIKLLSDRVTTKDQPNLMERPTVKIETLLDAPGVKEDPELDKYISRARDIREVKIKESDLAALHKRYDTMKKDFIRTKFKKDDVKDTGERDQLTNERIYTVTQGEI